MNKLALKVKIARKLFQINFVVDDNIVKFKSISGYTLYLLTKRFKIILNIS